MAKSAEQLAQELAKTAANAREVMAWKRRMIDARSQPEAQPVQRAATIVPSVPPRGGRRGA